MCYFLNADYTCSPEPTPARAHKHNSRTSVLCSNPIPCPLPLWETRTQLWPFPCPNCTGETTPYEPPDFDCWNDQEAEVHDESVIRYLTNLTRLLNATILAHTPTSTPGHFLSAHSHLLTEAFCRQHFNRPSICACPASGDRSWACNISSTLRSGASATAARAFLSNPTIAATIAGSLRDEVTAMIQSVTARCPMQNFEEETAAGLGYEVPEAHIHAHLDPRRRVSESTVFSETESSRRLDFAISAQDAAMATMSEIFAPLPWHVAKPAETGMRFRLQVVRTFSVFAINDPGLSPFRADMILERLAGLILDPVLLPSISPPEFDETRPLLGELMSHLSRPPNNGPTVHNPFTDLHDWLSRYVQDKKVQHSRELEESTAHHLAFRSATYPKDIDYYLNKKYWPRNQQGKSPPKDFALPKNPPTNVRCPRDDCRRARTNPPLDADPRDYHTPRVKVRDCGHVMGRRCAYKAGEETSRWEGRRLVWVCPACNKVVRHVAVSRGLGETGFQWPYSATMNGEMERAVMRRWDHSSYVPAL